MNLRDWGSPGHFYTSYPGLNHWTEDFTHNDFVEAFEKSLGEKNGFHLYIHIPFCKKLCHYCICNIVITNDREKIQFFLDHLLKEIDNLKKFNPDIREIHLGGGTPSHLDQAQFTQLCDKLNTLSPLKEMTEVAMEIDPRTVNQDDLRHYASHGITRISFGIQDFNIDVQEAINRVQPPEMIEDLLKVRHLFRGVNFDLLYGLPKQNLETFNDTLDKTFRMRPERVTLLKYCHAPEVRKHMKLINVTDLPTNLEEMFRHAVERFVEEGYVWVGLDHFALPHDSLAVAHKNKSLVRTFNGFKPGPTKNMIGLGPTSSYALYDVYAQAHYDLNQYYESVNKGEFPILRGIKLTPDDISRRHHIFEILCNQELFISHGGYQEQLFELSKVKDIVEAVQSNHFGTLFTIKDQFLLRNICSLFDARDVKPEHLKIAQKTITRRPLESPLSQSA